MSSQNFKEITNDKDSKNNNSSISRCLSTILIIVIIGFSFKAFGILDAKSLKSSEPVVPLKIAAISTNSIPELIQSTTVNTPSQTESLPANTGRINESIESISCNYSWTYQGGHNWEINIPLSLYEYYKKIPRSLTNDYSVYITNPLDDLFIDSLAKKLNEAAKKDNLNNIQTIEYVTAFAQSLPYSVDNVTTPYNEYPRYPIETLVDNGGDCEDTSILLASLLDGMNYDVVLIMFPNHCAVGISVDEEIPGTYYIYKGIKYYYLETTEVNWGIGEIPIAYKGKNAHIYEMVPIPLLTHEWQVTNKVFSTEVEIAVFNSGTASADNVTVFVAFDAGNGRVLNPQQSNSFSIGTNEKVNFSLNIKIPFGVYTRMVVKICINNITSDESYSEWFETY